MPGAAGNLAAGKFLMQFIVQSENIWNCLDHFAFKKPTTRVEAVNLEVFLKSQSPCGACCVAFFPSWKMQLDVRTRQDSKQW